MKVTGKNIVKLNLCGLAMNIDLDEDWSRLKLEPFEEQLEQVSSSIFWLSHIHGVDMDPSAIAKFWMEFEKPEAERARDVAVSGLKVANYGKLFHLLKDARDFINARDSGDFEKLTGEALDFKMKELAMIGLSFCNIAAKGDHKDFRRMAEVLQARGIPEGKRDEEDSLNGQMIREFCLHVVNHRALPTKKQLREAVGLSGDKEDAERFRTAAKQLGLGGLPQAS